jgi:MOSC domain-containing protein YiiM
VYINTSSGGVPKLHVGTADITVGGVAGDSQADKRHHGGQDRAVCLYSLEHIVALQQEGHPIYPGSTGENLTISGITWDSLIPGVCIEIGEARLMVTSFTTPCRTIRESFTDDHIARISQKVHPGWSRVYAKVLMPGRVTVGDPVLVLPV